MFICIFLRILPVAASALSILPMAESIRTPHFTVVDDEYNTTTVDDDDGGGG